MVFQPTSIKSEREQANLSQAELAEKAKLSQNYISQIELGRKKPSIKALEQIAIALGVEMSVFLNPPVPSPGMATRRKRGRRREATTSVA